MTSSSMCPHLVQEYFERVSEILVTYRPQILKQVEYDKISENLILRGAIRQEEHERIYVNDSDEGRVSQMLVVIQNRMWGLENLLAAFMEEHVSTWLTQELFRAYMDHLVNPLKKLQERPRCQCVLMSNSVLYRGWVRALKSLDSLILKTGTSLGFMKQTLYPTDNMLTFLSEKLAEYTGGDSMSSSYQDDLVPYGFAPNASGEVQVAELEEDDINDLIALSATLSITYPNCTTSSQNEESVDYPENTKVPEQTENPDKLAGEKQLKGYPVVVKPVMRKSSSPTQRKSSGAGRASPELTRTRRQRSVKERTNDTKTPSESLDDGEKLQKQKQLIDRLSAPKSIKNSETAQSRTPSRNSDTSTSSSRPSSASSSTTPVTAGAKSKSLQRSTSHYTPSSSAAKTTTSGKAIGIVRSKSVDPSNTSPKLRSGRGSTKTRPTAVAKPNPKLNRGIVKQEEVNEIVIVKENDTKSAAAEKDPKEPSQDPTKPSPLLSSLSPTSKDEKEPRSLSPLEGDTKPTSEDEDDDDDILPGMSSLFLKNTILASEEEQAKNRGYYQLNFDYE